MTKPRYILIAPVSRGPSARPILQHLAAGVTPISPRPPRRGRRRSDAPIGYAEQVERSLLDSPSYRLIRALGRHKALVAAGLERHGLHLGQEFYLAQLWREDGITSADLAARTGVSAPAVTKVVSGLERAGLVHRERDPADARLVRVWMTDAGRALREPVTGHLVRRRAGVLGRADRRGARTDARGRRHPPGLIAHGEPARRTRAQQRTWDRRDTALGLRGDSRRSARVTEIAFRARVPARNAECAATDRTRRTIVPRELWIDDDHVVAAVCAWPPSEC